ncbi:restriction endonuclease subunit S [Heliophilum fasciatum]|uniref:Type I restriction enzyme S subunit n=1 Tax=Heliophilum fasciatum TaxID=35700 RepID=A0A4R2R9H3_9FIRM|nr:restriction endonuclease subunit S [Heliophilum fasciatum]MCW2279447.1 type I restriction enzyme S subunit [Heliophilum fasciatum]TCP59882.1 type I restriction enzyme S subunit [Heliophilum fasciatum]
MRKLKIGDVGKIITGKTPKTSVTEYYNDEFPFITPADFSELKAIRNTSKKISMLGLNSIKNCLIPKHSICVTCIGSDMGKVAITEIDSATNQQINSVVPYEDFDPDFIYYAIKYASPHIKLMGETSTAVPIINKKDFSKVEIFCPETKEEQVSIANQLAIYDRKIEKNVIHMMLLKEIVSVVYKNWFNDFNYLSSTGELVKNKNLNRDVPSGWNVLQFKDFLTPNSEKIGDVDAPIYSTTNKGITFRDEKFNKNLTKSQKNNKKVVKDDLIFGLSREILNFGVFTDEIGSVSPAYQIFKIDQSVILPFILELEIRINMSRYMDILQLGAREGQGIRKDYLLHKHFLVPKMEVQQEFSKIYIVMQKKISKLKEENDVLSEIRDTLLPKLMSRELPVEVDEANV